MQGSVQFIGCQFTACISKILISDPCSSIASSFIFNSPEAEFCDCKKMKDEVFYVLYLPRQLSNSNQYTLDWFQHLSFLLPIAMYSNRTNLSLLEKEVKRSHSGRSVCSSYLERVIVAVVYLKFISLLVWRRGSRRHRPGTNLKCFIASCHSPPWGGSCKQTLRTGSSCFSHTQFQVSCRAYFSLNIRSQNKLSLKYPCPLEHDSEIQKLYTQLI